MFNPCFTSPRVKGTTETMYMSACELTWAFRDSTCLVLLQRALLRTAQEIAKGMDYIHSFGIIHGDLKLGNVLLKTHRVDRRGYVAKVSDFGKCSPHTCLQYLQTSIMKRSCCNLDASCTVHVCLSEPGLRLRHAISAGTVGTVCRLAHQVDYAYLSLLSKLASCSVDSLHNTRDTSCHAPQELYISFACCVSGCSMLHSWLRTWTHAHLMHAVERHPDARVKHSGISMSQAYCTLCNVGYMWYSCPASCVPTVAHYPSLESMDACPYSQAMTHAACMSAGLSRPLQESEQDVPAGNHVGTIMYTAPETFRDSRLTKPGDVYAFGIMSEPSCAC